MSTYWQEFRSPLIFFIYSETKIVSTKVQIKKLFAFTLSKESLAF